MTDSSKTPRHRIWLMLSTAVVVGLGVAGLLYHLTTGFFVREAEHEIEDVLIHHQAVHRYFQDNTHEALSQLIGKGRVTTDFYYPELLSSPYMLRQINKYFNEERTSRGLPPISYRLAAVNPRNPVYEASESELELIEQFNSDRTLTSRRRIVEKDGRKYLEVSHPFLETSEGCLGCHGQPSDAPGQILARYPDNAGYFMEMGQVRAIESVQVPIGAELKTAYLVFAGLVVGAALILVMTLMSRRLKSQVARRTKELRESEDRYRKLFELSPDPIVIVDAQARIVSVNHCMADWMEYEELELVGQYVFEADFIESADIKIIRENFVRRRSGEEVAPYTIRFRTPTGKALVGELTGTTIEGSDILTMVVIRDVTEQTRDQERLQDQLDFVQTLLDTIPSPVFYKDMAGRYLGCNQAFAEFFDTSRDDLIGRTVYDINQGESADMFFEKDRELFDHPGQQTYEWEAHRADGQTRKVVYHKATFRDNRGEPAGLVGVMTDVTESRQALEAVQESEARYRSLVESSTLGISLIGADMELISANSRIGKWWPDVRLDGHPKCYQAYHGPRTKEPCSRCPVVRALEDGEVHEDLLTHELENGTSTFRRVAAPVKNPDGEITAVLETMEDVTEKLRMEAELLKARKLESLGVLAGGIAHDFNNILTAILGNLSLVRMDSDVGGETSGLIDEAEQAAARARGLTQQLLTFSKGGDPILKTASIGAQVRDCAEFVLRGSNVLAEFNIDPELRPVEVDEGQISQVISNLVINAMQAMPSGGKVEVICRNITLESGTELPLGSGEYVEIVVRDEGIGISERHLANIFDPFFTTKQTGHGLGLATSYAIVQKHSGHMTVHSQQGSGSVFTIYLPVSEHTPQSYYRPVSRSAEGHGRVLVVDDEESIRRLAIVTLERSGYEVEAVPDCAVAINAYAEARSSGQSYDAVVMDLTIPGGMGGVEGLNRLIEIDPEVRAIVSSGYSSDPVMADFESYGFKGRVAKPYKSGELARAVGEILAVDVIAGE